MRIVLQQLRVSDSIDKVSNVKTIFTEFIIPMVRYLHISAPNERYNLCPRARHLGRLT